jgi:hypothetical protein
MSGRTYTILQLTAPGDNGLLSFPPGSGDEVGLGKWCLGRLGCPTQKPLICGDFRSARQVYRFCMAETQTFRDAR